MKIPAIVSILGNRTYYVCSMTFEQITESVKKVDSELHKSEQLSQLLQRSITNNFKNISKYILEHSDRFFNSLVLAVYGGDPQFQEVRFEYEHENYGDMGLLKFDGTEKIFPVDGQHRVEGIKKALEDNPELASERVPVIFIGHNNTPEGMESTRRLFSTLNRYAKPVKKSDIIALDEDDILAITTRHLVENHQLFNGERISLSTNLNQGNNVAFTTIETLYDCTKYLFETYYKEHSFSGGIANYLRNRPSDETIDEFKTHCFEFWNDFINSLDSVKSYLSRDDASIYRDSDGGNLLFRPVGLSPFVKAVAKIKMRTSESYLEILNSLSTIEFALNEKPWADLIWNTSEKKVIPSNNLITYSLFLYLHDINKQTPSDELSITHTETKKMIEKYSLKLSISHEEAKNYFNR